MPRNSSGTYTLPSGNPVVSGTLIEANWANTTLSDLASAMTNSLSRGGEGGMTAALRLFDGTVSLPGLAFTNETSTGFYRAGSGDMRLSVTGSEVMQFLATGASVTGTFGVSGAVTLSGGTANGVGYLNGSKVLTTGSALTFDGAILGVNGVSVGRGAGSVSTNTAVGASALAGSNSGTGLNTGLGYQALQSNTTGSYNTAVGVNSVQATTTGAYNNGFGTQALQNNTTGSSNVAVGSSALQNNTTASNNTAVGYQAAYSNTGTGARLTFVGYQAGYSTVGGTSCGFGSEALYSNTTGDDNTAIGSYRPLYSNTTGSSNVAVGRQALQANTTASNNTAVGYQAGYTSTTGIGTYLGYQAGYAVTTGQFNTFVGVQAGSGVTTGAKNTIIGGYNGNQGGLDIRTLSNRVVLSDGDGNVRGYFDNSGNFMVGTVTQRGTAGITLTPNTSAGAGEIAFNRSSTTSTSYVVGFQNAGSTIGYIAYNNSTVTYNTGSDARLKDNVATAPASGPIIDAIQIVQHDWKSGGHADFSVIAQDLHPVYPQAVTPGDAGEVITQTWGVDYSKLVPLLVKEIQSLRARVAAIETI